jgi:hypothetical protein
VGRRDAIINPDRPKSEPSFCRVPSLCIETQACEGGCDETPVEIDPAALDAWLDSYSAQDYLPEAED